MIITAIKIKKMLNTGTKLIGIADLTFDDMFVLHEIKILSNKGEMFLAMPSRKTNTGFKDIVHPISAEPRNKLEEILYELYGIVLESENMILVIIPGISEPPVRTLRATIPENERHIFR